MPAMKTLLISLTALMLTACGPEFETDDADALKGGGSSTTTTTSKHLARTTDATGTSPVWQDSFPISGTPDVFTAFDLSVKKGKHTLTVFIFGDGFAYERVDIPFAVETQAGPGEQQAEKIATGTYRVWSRLLVANTAIDQYGLTGNWKADGHLDGSATATASAPFTLW
jgi:hypothetical protein